MGSGRPAAWPSWPSLFPRRHVPALAVRPQPVPTMPPEGRGWVRMFPNASLEDFQRSPLRRRQFRASTPSACPVRPVSKDPVTRGPHSRPEGPQCVSPSARRCHPPDSLRPCRSARLRRVSPLDTLQVCCALQPTVGFAPFRPISRPTSLAPKGSTKSASARDLPEAHIPFEAFPSSKAVPRHRGHCLLAVEPHTLHPIPSANGRESTARMPESRPQGLAPSTNPLLSQRVSARRRPMLPWASDPLEDRQTSLGAPPPHREGPPR